MNKTIIPILLLGIATLVLIPVVAAEKDPNQPWMIEYYVHPLGEEEISLLNNYDNTYVAARAIIPYDLFDLPNYLEVRCFNPETGDNGQISFRLTKVPTNTATTAMGIDNDFVITSHCYEKEGSPTVAELMMIFDASAYLR